MRFDAVFTNRIAYTKTIHDDIRAWVEANIHRWMAENRPWFNIELVPNEFLPTDVFVAKGGFERDVRRSSLFGGESIGNNNNVSRVAPEQRESNNNSNNNVRVAPEPAD